MEVPAKLAMLSGARPARHNDAGLKAGGPWRHGALGHRTRFGGVAAVRRSARRGSGEGWGTMAGRLALLGAGVRAELGSGMAMGGWTTTKTKRRESALAAGWPRR